MRAKDKYAANGLAAFRQRTMSRNPELDERTRVTEQKALADHIAENERRQREAVLLAKLTHRITESAQERAWRVAQERMRSNLEARDEMFDYSMYSSLSTSAAPRCTGKRPTLIVIDDLTYDRSTP